MIKFLFEGPENKKRELVEEVPVVIGSGSDEFEIAEKLRQMEIEFSGDGAPGEPVVVTFHATALVEVGAPDFAGLEFQTGEEFLKQSQRDLQSQTPFDRFGHAFDLAGKSVVDGKLIEVLFLESIIFGDAVSDRIAVPVRNKIGEDRSGTVDFKIDVFFAAGLDEKFHTAVKTDVGVVFCFDAADILIVHFIEQIKVAVIVTEFCDGSGTVSGAFGKSIVDLERRKIFPAAVVQTAGEIDGTSHPANIVFHVIISLKVRVCTDIKIWQPRQDSNLD